MSGPAKTRHLRQRTLVALVLLPLALGIQRLSARFPETVEALYSRTAFPPIVRTLAWLSSRAPFSLGEAGLACAGLAFIVALVWGGRALWRGRGRRWRILGQAIVVALLVAGLGYTAFLLSWGWNYQRRSFARSAGLPVLPSNRGELAALSADLVEAANHLREGLPEDEHGAMRLPDGTRATLARTALGVAALTRRYPWLPECDVHPKLAWTSPLLARLGIAGFYFPLTAEPHVDGEILPSELPFSASHEVAHELGFAREGEANYLGYLACRLHPDADFNYSGVFLASRFVLGALASLDPAEARALGSRRSPAVQRDLAALKAWRARFGGPAMDAALRVNDAHLRFQGQRDGLRSYGRMVDLLLAERRLERHEEARDAGQ